MVADMSRCWSNPGDFHVCFRNRKPMKRFRVGFTFGKKTMRTVKERTKSFKKGCLKLASYTCIYGSEEVWSDLKNADAGINVPS